MNARRSVIITHHSSLITSLLVLICLVAAARVIATYRVFNHTYDEGAHVGAGLEWLTEGSYTREQQHPPLQRVAAGIGPYVAGARFNPARDLSRNGIDAFHMDGRYSTILSFARAGTLPFWIFSIIVVFLWSRALFSPAVGLLSAAVYSFLPPVLAHAGFATTDMSLTAMLPAALFSIDQLLRKPSWRSAALAGVTVAGSLVSKMSALLFLTVGAVAVVLCWWIDRRRGVADPLTRRAFLPAIGFAIVCAFLAIWAVYRFSVGPVLPPDQPWKFDSLASTDSAKQLIRRLGAIPIPAPEFLGGVGELLVHNKMGHWSYLMGERKEGGWWYYFPIALALKTPIAFLILTGVSIFAVSRLASRAAFAPVLAAGTILLASLPSKINIGIRHVLPMYPLLAVISGAGLVWLWRATRFRDLWRAAAVALSLWLIAPSIAIHPDYVAYFNEFAGKRPEYYLLDSNLDWGQDLLRLKREIRRRRIDSLMLSYFGTADPERLNFPPLRQVDFGNPRPGWFAVSEQHVYAFPWLRYFQPIVKPGPSMRLYYIPEVTE